MPQAGAWQHQGRHRRVGHMHREPGRDERRRAAGCQDERSVQTSMQIDRGSHGTMVGWQPPLVQPRVKHDEFDGVQAPIPLTRAHSPPALVEGGE